MKILTNKKRFDLYHKSYLIFIIIQIYNLTCPPVVTVVGTVIVVPVGVWLDKVVSKNKKK